MMLGQDHNLYLSLSIFITPPSKGGERGLVVRALHL